MDVIVDNLPGGAIPCMPADLWATITYIDFNHEIREMTLYKGHPDVIGTGNFFPRFMVPKISPEEEAFLIEALKREAPNAEEIRILRNTAGNFFMCAVTPP